MTRPTPHRGYLILVALIFGSVFLMTLAGLSSFILSQNRLQGRTTANTEALTIAEAGIEYYRWHLSHYPDDLQNGTGAPGPYAISYLDPETGEERGVATLEITGNTACGEDISVDITSTGVPASDPSASRTVTTRYARPSVGAYSYVLNDSVWAGADRVINGPFHSNGGIRMDGTANAPVTSSLSSWNCTSSYGCSPASSTASGVLGDGPNQELWSWPVPQVDFSGIAADFGNLKTIAESQGMYFDRYSTTNGQGEPAYWRGYHLVFNANGSVTVTEVSSTNSLSVTPINSADASTDRALRSNESADSIEIIPPDCGLIFVEDNVWIEGTVSGKITLVAANVVNANIAPNVYIVDDIVYDGQDGEDGLTVIAEHNVLIAPDAPNSLTLNGIFIAQNGAFGMNAYACNSGYATKTGTLSILGTTVSSKRTGTKWTSTCSGYYKGYQTRVDSYDRNMAIDPAPFTPVVSADYEFVDWREE